MNFFDKMIFVYEWKEGSILVWKYYLGLYRSCVKGLIDFKRILLMLLYNISEYEKGILGLRIFIVF